MPLPQRVLTERLVLRRHLRADAAPLARLLDNWNVVRWLAQVPFPYTEKDALDWIAQTARNWAEGRDYQFVVARRGDDTLVGHIGLRIDRSGRGGELGYWFGQPYWGLGYAAEAAHATIAFGFEALGLERIWATCLPDNRRSLRVLAKAGLLISGRRVQEFPTLGEAVEVPVLALRRTDWAGSRAAS